MTLAPILAYAVALGIAAGIPGPGVTALVGRSLGTGFWATLPMLMGVVIGDLIYLTAAVLGLALLAKAFGAFFLAVKLIGAGYLLWLAWRFWRAGVAISPVRRANGKREALASFLFGLFVTLSNPKTIVFYMAILPVVVDLKSVTPGGYVALVVVTLLVLVVVMTPYILLASKARKLLERPAMQARLNRIVAVVLTSTAGWIIARA